MGSASMSQQSAAVGAEERNINFRKLVELRLPDEALHDIEEGILKRPVNTVDDLAELAEIAAWYMGTFDGDIEGLTKTTCCGVERVAAHMVLGIRRLMLNKATTQTGVLPPKSDAASAAPSSVQDGIMLRQANELVRAQYAMWGDTDEQLASKPVQEALDAEIRRLESRIQSRKVTSFDDLFALGELGAYYLGGTDDSHFVNVANSEVETTERVLARLVIGIRGLAPKELRQPPPETSVTDESVHTAKTDLPSTEVEWPRFENERSKTWRMAYALWNLVCTQANLEDEANDQDLAAVSKVREQMHLRFVEHANEVFARPVSPGDVEALKARAEIAAYWMGEELSKFLEYDNPYERAYARLIEGALSFCGSRPPFDRTAGLQAG